MSAESWASVALLFGQGLLRERPVAAVALEGVQPVRGADSEESLFTGWTSCRAPESLRGADANRVEDC